MCPKLRGLQTPSHPVTAVTGKSSKLSCQAAKCKCFAIPSPGRGSRPVSLPVYVHLQPMLYRQLHKKTRQEQQSSSDTKQLEGLSSQPHCISELQPAPGLLAHGTPAPAVEHKLCAFPAQMYQSAQLTLKDLHSGSQPLHIEYVISVQPFKHSFQIQGHSRTTCKVSFHASSMEHCLYSMTD